MKLIDLVSYFRLGGTFEDFCKTQALNAESEVIEIYAQKPVNLDSQLGFFPIEETEGQVEFLAEGTAVPEPFRFFLFLGCHQRRQGQYASGRCRACSESSFVRIE